MEGKKKSLGAAAIVLAALIIVAAFVFALSSERVWQYITCASMSDVSLDAPDGEDGGATSTASPLPGGEDETLSEEGEEDVSFSDLAAMPLDHEDVFDADYKSDYYIVVYTLNCSVMVLQKDENGRYTEQVKAFLCSPGADETPTVPGVYPVYRKHDWRFMMDVYGHYCTGFGRGTGYLFHSVPYAEEDNRTLTNNYDKLGTRASHGCIRMCTRDAKWIYDNIPYGTLVHVVDGKNGPEGEPVPQRNRSAYRYLIWDPTDPDPSNPYLKDPPAEGLTYFTHTSYGTTTTTAYEGN
ncbi:MAG: L,D-transpeptidase family protein [Clostridia bacterium]|nr:L,D-transpeptidase family protein [Clostridia bacterium]